MIMDFIRTQQQQGRAVESTCRVLRGLGVQVAARTYRAWASHRTVSPRALALAYLMTAVFTLAFAWDPATAAFRLRPEGLYGRRKMTALLARTGQQASYERVHAAMSALGHNGIRRARRHRTTLPGKDGTRAGDLLNRDFTAPAPNMVWVTDFTYVRTWIGFVYVAFLVDVFAQRIVAWHALTNKTTDLVMTPLRMALWQRDHEGHPVGRGELVHHSDAGSQYTSIRLTEHLAIEGIAPSIGTVGDAYDNALMESIIGLYKTECIGTTVFHDGPYKTLADVEFATAGWVEWYNNTRLHSSIGMEPPAEFERTHYAALNLELQSI
jgi:transposase InsO family protein